MNYRRIACLSTEAVETLYLLGAEDCIAGISGFTTRPGRARKEKPKVSGFSSAKIERILAVTPDPAEVVRRAPDIIVGSWCGKKFRPEQVRARVGWEMIPAVRGDELHEIKSADILSPGPGAITEGLAQLERIVTRWAQAAKRP